MKAPVFTKPALAVAKYCNKHVCIYIIYIYVCVCVSVCLSVREHIARTTRDLYQIFVHFAFRPGSVLLWRGDAIQRGCGNFEGFLPIVNALCSIALGVRTYTKTAEPI